ncbi:hypothetical protein BHM03_00016062 [Ensete ventricosum]|nr:hypothetical protein BHM03_00016062 [Ensete ventricosum]
MRVDFPRWEEGDLISWISQAKRYFRFHRTADAAMVEIVAINHEGDAIQRFNWFEHTRGGRTRRQFKEGLLNRFGPIDYENIDGHLEKIRQTTTIQEIGIGITNPSTVAEEEIGNGGKRQGSSDAASASEEEGSNSDGDYMGCRGRWGRAATAMVASGEGRRRAVALA